MWTNRDQISRYEIQKDETVGYYIYKYDLKGKCMHDYLQDTLDAAMDFTNREFGLDRNGWKEMPSRE